MIVTKTYRYTIFGSDPDYPIAIHDGNPVRAPGPLAGQEDIEVLAASEEEAWKEVLAEATAEGSPGAMLWVSLWDLDGEPLGTRTVEVAP